jgi:Family of unknown function (DUF5771)
MEEETGKRPVPIGSGLSCPSGTIRRRGYTAKRRGTTYRVKSACIKDRGSKGRWQTVRRMLGIGPLRQGDLTGLGYHATDKASIRHAALDKVVSRYGKVSALRKVNAIATYTKRTAPSRSRTYKTDLHYIQKKYF